MSWGSLWGSYWGGDPPNPAKTRLFYFLRESPNIQTLVEIIDDRMFLIMSVIQLMTDAFDLDLAQDHQLDIIGQWLGRDREGMSDDRYRRALRVQRTILKSTGTASNMMQIWKDWIGSPPSDYSNIPPATISIGGTIDASDEYLLRIFLRTAAPAGVRLDIAVATDGDAFQYDVGPGYDQGYYAT